jgi:hypothetical protein
MAVRSDNTEFVGEAVGVVPVSSYLKVSRYFQIVLALLMEKLGRNPFAALCCEMPLMYVSPPLS